MLYEEEYCFSCCDLLEQLQYMKTHVHVYILQIGKKYSHHTYPFIYYPLCVEDLHSPGFSLTKI